MKKIFFNVLSVSLIAGALTSCGKTTKGKMANEWNITSIIVKDYNEDGDGSTTTTNSTSVVETTTYNGVSETNTIATVNSNTMTISKDGTWESIYDYTSVVYDTNTVGATYKQYKKTTTNGVVTKSGTWSFVATNKTDEFKKNERVIFNTTKSNRTTDVTEESSSSLDPTVTTTKSNYTDTETFKAGNNTLVYTVKESTSKKLVLISEGNYSEQTSSTSEGGATTQTNHTNTSSGEMILEQK